MAKLKKQGTGSQYVPKRLGEDTAAVTISDLNKLIGDITASTGTLIEMTSSGEPREDGQLVDPGPEYGPEELNDNFATIAQVLNNINTILQEAGLINEYVAPPDISTFSEWTRCDEVFGDQIWLNEADTGLLQDAMEDNGAWSIVVDAVTIPYLENDFVPAEDTNWTFAELQAAGIIYLESCPE